VLAQVGRNRWIISQRRNGAWRGQCPAFFGLRIGIKRQRLLCVPQRFVDVVTGREATRQVREPYFNGCFSSASSTIAT
jgi:hypothetical protein